MQKKKKNNQHSYFIGSIFAAKRRKYSNKDRRKAMWNFNKKIPLRDSGKDRWNGCESGVYGLNSTAITCPIWGLRCI